MADLEPLDDTADGEFAPLLANMSAEACAAYRALVYETPGFETYFRQSTPVVELADLKIGSRPASRTASSAATIAYWAKGSQYISVERSIRAEASKPTLIATPRAARIASV